MTEPAPATLRFDVLGPLRVVLGDGRHLDINGRKQRQLLSLLVLFRNTPLTPGRLVHELWGEQAPRSAEVTLRSHVSHLRRHLATAAADHLVTTGPNGYVLALEPGQVDADQAETWIGEAQEALGLGHPTSAVTLCRRALALWRGRAFADLDDVESADVEAGRLDELRLEALETLGTAELQCGRHRELVGELESWVSRSPFRERFSALLMVALYRSGRQTEALEAFARTRERLADELGLDPGPELQDLEQSILRQEPVLLEGIPATSPATSLATSPLVATPARSSDAMLEAAMRSPMVGRTAEMARLDSAWRDVVGGGRRCVLLSGEAGIGKTRLVADLAHRVEQTGGIVLVGRCETGAAPYHAVVDALASHPAATDAGLRASEGVRDQLALLQGPDTTGSAKGTPQRPRQAQAVALYAAVAEVLGRLAAAAPTLVLIDDAERLDRATSLLLRHVVAQQPPGLLLVVAYRDPPGGRHPPLLELLGDVGVHAMTERLVLGRLTEADVSGLLADTRPDLAPDVAGRLWAHSGGNPYFASEMARSLATGETAQGGWSVPTGVRDLLRHRLADLTDNTRRVVATASVLGATVDVEPLGLMLGGTQDDTAEALAEAQRAGIIVESTRDDVPAYAFPHDLMRDAVLADLDPVTRRKLHAEAAQALMATSPGGRGAAAVAVQLRLAGAQADPGEAAEWSLRAADEARAVYGWDEAVEHGEAAVALLEQRAAAARDDLDVAVALADAAVSVGGLRVLASLGLERAVELFEKALPLYVRAGRDAALGALHSRLGSVLSLHHSVMDVPRALEHFDAAERLLPEPVSLRAFHLHRGRSQAAMFGLRPTLAAEAGSRAQELATTLGRRDLGVVVGWSRAWAAFDLGDVDAAGVILESSWSTAHELADPYLGWSPANAGALVHTGFLLDPDRARSWCRRGLRQPRFTSFSLPHTTVLDQLALALAESGELATARDAASTLPPDAVSRRMLTFLDGEWEQAVQAWRAAAAADEASGDLRNFLVNVRWLSAALVALGEHAEAGHELDRLLALALDAPQVPTELYVRATLAQLNSALAPGDARDHLARCDQIVANGEDWRGLLGLVELARASVADASDELEVSEASYRRAIEVFSRFHLPWRQAAALEDWASSRDHRGEHELAAQTRRRARAVYDAMGAASRWRDRAPVT